MTRCCGWPVATDARAPTTRISVSTCERERETVCIHTWIDCWRRQNDCSSGIGKETTLMMADRAAHGVTRRNTTHRPHVVMRCGWAMRQNTEGTSAAAREHCQKCTTAKTSNSPRTRNLGREKTKPCARSLIQRKFIANQECV